MTALAPVLILHFNLNNMKNDKLGIAIVGLGSYGGGQITPALLQTEHCYLAGIVTGDASKAKQFKEQYNIPETNIYNYSNFDEIKNNTAIDIVYVVLPNSMHAEYVVRAAKAGKHIICEKPMAVSAEECDTMITACKEAGKMLSIGYRLHFDPFHLEIKRMGTQKVFGSIKKISSGFGQPSKKGEWRLNKALAGGGPLMDLGIYCFQAVCYTTGQIPVAITAHALPVTDKEKFIDIEETLIWEMEMPDGIIAECKTSYSDVYNFIRVDAENGWFELDPAFSYSGIKGSTSQEKIEFTEVSQQAKQMDDFALAIKHNRPSPVPGEMGRRDVKIIEAIYEAMKTGKRIMIDI